MRRFASSGLWGWGGALVAVLGLFGCAVVYCGQKPSLKTSILSKFGKSYFWIKDRLKKLLVKQAWIMKSCVVSVACLRPQCALPDSKAGVASVFYACGFDHASRSPHAFGITRRYLGALLFAIRRGDSRRRAYAGPRDIRTPLHHSNDP